MTLKTTPTYEGLLRPYVMNRSLHPPQLWLLLALRGPERRARFVTEVAAEHGLVTATLHRAGRMLSEAGFVVRSKAKGPTMDRRGKVKLTASAMRAMLGSEADQDRVMRVMHEIMASPYPGLSLRQVWLLFWLNEPQPEEPRTASSAASIIGMDRAVTWRAAAALERLSLIERVPTAGRTQPLKLSAEGTALINQILEQVERESA